MSVALRGLCFYVLWPRDWGGGFARDEAPQTLFGIAPLAPLMDGVLENFGNLGMDPSSHMHWEGSQETVRTANWVR